MLVVFALETAAGPASVKAQVRSHNADLGGDPRVVPRSGSNGTGFKPTSSSKAASSATRPLSGNCYKARGGVRVQGVSAYTICVSPTLMAWASLAQSVSTRALGSVVSTPLTRTGPHPRTHSMPIKHIVPPLIIHIHTHSMSNSTCTSHAHRTCAHRAQRVHHTRTDASPATASLTQ
jgi:hypothetical protein